LLKSKKLHSLKIVLLGEKSFDSSGYHIATTLESFGCTVKTIAYKDGFQLPNYKNFASYFHEYGPKVFPSIDTRLAKRLSRKVIAEKPDLLFVLYWNLHPNLLSFIKKKLPEIKTIHFNSDAITNFQRQQLFVTNFDFYITKEPYIAQFMKDKLGLNAHYLSEWFNPKVHQKPTQLKQLAEAETNIDVLAFGNMYPYRTKILEHLKNAGINLTLFGKKGPFFPESLEKNFQNTYLTGGQKAKMLYGAKIVFNNFHYAEITAANNKFFEINGIGAFQISDDAPTLAEYLPTNLIGKTSFKTTEEAIDLIKYYLVHPKERYEISQQVYSHFQKNHTIGQWLKKVFQLIGIE